MKCSSQKTIFLSLILGSCAILWNACKVSIPEGARAIQPFNINKYLGKWYEIARLDFKYERNLNNVTATYSLKEDGTIKVDNRGFDTVKKQWKQSIGKAKPVKNPQEGRLKVSFFGPFYAGYNIIAIDSAYNYALIAGNNLDYLWMLSRTPQIPEAIKQTYLKKAGGLGYKTENLVWTKHDK